VPTPFIREVDDEKTSIILDYIDGQKIRKILNGVSSDERIKICTKAGKSTGLLHKNHIIHGDLTTSNMIKSGGKIYFIDFGLGEINESVEAKGVDLLVFVKSLRSTHFEHEKECLDAFFDGYREEFSASREILERLRAIEKRGRYFSSR